MQQQQPTVVIVGAGFCGTAVAVHLLRQLPPSARLVLVEQDARLARGVAYGTRCLSHRLNVPAGRLGLEPGHESGFIEWLQQHHEGWRAADFVPRALMGDYLAHCLQQAREAAAARGLAFECISGVAVTGMEPRRPGHLLALSDGRQLLADQVVLANGHLPTRPLHLPALAWGEPGLLADPWSAEALDSLPEDAAVLVLGTGLTAIDLWADLQDRGHQGQITLLSRRGQLPQPHRSLEARPFEGPSPVAQLPVDFGLRQLMRSVRRWAREAPDQGRDWRDVLASLRGSTPSLWQRLSPRERRQFLRHVQPWWDTHRHRLAPGLHRRLEAAIGAGHVLPLAGRIRSLQRLPDGRLRVGVQHRGSALTQHLDVSLIVNCTGASSALRHTDQALLASLREQGLLTPDELDLGLLVDEQYRPQARDASAVQGLRYVGPMLKAQRWEAVAVPELRQHAGAVAARVLEDLALPGRLT